MSGNESNKLIGLAVIGCGKTGRIRAEFSGEAIRLLVDLADFEA
jgi:hypothetical protein